MRISVIGTGYVGLVSGVCLAETGHEVVCVDLDEAKVGMINRGQPPIYEQGLEELLQKNVQRGALRATSDLRQAVLETRLSLIAVGTPLKDDAIDLSYVREATRQIGCALAEKSDYHVVVVKSTVVPGTTDAVVIPVLEEASGKTAGADFGVGVNPEFLREGQAVEDFLCPDRLVLGGIDERTLCALEEVYSVFRHTDRVRTNNRTAETIKYTSNSLLATLISFSNEIANLCAAIGGVDALDVMRGVHLDKRISPIMPDGSRVAPALTTYLEGGCGFGGSCFPKDVRALVSRAADAGLTMPLLGSVLAVNERQPEQMLTRLRKHFPDLEGRRVAVLGLAFKPGTDDMRESPAIPIIRKLLDEGALIRAYDPIARREAEKIFPDGVLYCDRLEEAIRDSEAILVITRWNEFSRLPELISAGEAQPLVVDGRRMLDKREIARYEGIGV
jgi:UDPglucose 6-dehydrogenase